MVNQSESESKKPLHEMFTMVPPHYDLINTLITWGMDRSWRNKAARTCLLGWPRYILDLCCGTGDLAITIAGMSKHAPVIKGYDYSLPMLDIATRKARQAGKAIKFIRGEVSEMPFGDAEFDCVGISFAFRNLTYKNPLAEAHLSEIVRVLKPGGRFVIVESSQPANRLIRALNHAYMRKYVAPLGGWISGNKAAYRYLAESTCRYYAPAEMREFLIQHGFRAVDYRPLFFGAAGIYIAFK